MRRRVVDPVSPLRRVAHPLRASQQLWDEHAAENPLWAILADPAKLDRRWNLERFFHTGVREIEALRYELATRQIAFGGAAALDFGCGVGRLTQALAPHFAEVIGVDISPKMVDIASSLNRFPDRVRYVVNPDSALTPLGDARFDCILSRLTLQHIEPDLSAQYVSALCQRLTTGGVLVFQLSSHKRAVAEAPQSPTMRVMPDEAYRAAIVYDGMRDGTLIPGGRITLDLRVANLSLCSWSQPEYGRMTIGNHWLDAASGRMIVRDDGRTGIPDRVRPHEVCAVPLSVTLPRQPGAYLCELDLSHEGLLWFEDKGSSTTRVAVTVSHDTAAVTPPSDVPPGMLVSRVDDSPAHDDRLLPLSEGDRAEPFPMHGVSKETVLQLIAQCDLDVISVQDDHSCGDDWVSYQYYARKTRGDR